VLPIQLELDTGAQAVRDQHAVRAVRVAFSSAPLVGLAWAAHELTLAFPRAARVLLEQPVGQVDHGQVVRKRVRLWDDDLLPTAQPPPGAVGGGVELGVAEPIGLLLQVPEVLQSLERRQLAVAAQVVASSDLFEGERAESQQVVENDLIALAEARELFGVAR